MSTPKPRPDPTRAQAQTLGDPAQDWQQLGEAMAQWWQAALRPLPSMAIPASPRSAHPAPGFPVSPERLAALSAAYQARAGRLWKAVMATPPGQAVPMMVPVPDDDRRFRHPAWRTSPFHALVLQSWLLHAEYLEALAANAELPPAEHARLRFMTRQVIDALAPSNFPATNPDALEQAIRTGGESVIRGTRNLIADARHGSITMSDRTAFAVGRNLATTQGSVVFQNDLIELIQYAPTTPTVHARPLVIIPPCINKFYILDLAPTNSFVRHALDHGHTTFMVSWRNIPPELGRLGWDDYLQSGVLQALRVAREITGAKSVNALGFCVGGTLLACALAVLAARKESLVASVTFLATMLDFSDPGDIGVYVTREFLALHEPRFRAGQRMRGAELASAFASLRSNELVWNYVVGNYLLGQTPRAFDLLHWNGDAANLPGPMYAYYLRELYLANRLRESDALTMLGERVDLARIALPTYVLATEGDHIVPWRSAFETTRLLGGDITFTLGASGHIAGVINPPASGKRNYWTSDVLADTPDQWRAAATSVAGSWWPHWSTWIARHAGRRKRAPAVQGDATHRPLRPAPGRYVIEAVD